MNPVRFIKWRYLFDVLSYGVIAVTLFWLAVPSSVFLKPLNNSYKKVDGEWVGHFQRLTPYGPILVSYTQRLEPAMDIHGMNSPSCTHSRYMPIEFNAEKGSIISYRAPIAVLPCLESARPMTDYIMFSVWIGPLRLRPVILHVIHD